MLFYMRWENKGLAESVPKDWVYMSQYSTRSYLYDRTVNEGKRNKTATSASCGRCPTGKCRSDDCGWDGKAKQCVFAELKLYNDIKAGTADTSGVAMRNVLDDGLKDHMPKGCIGSKRCVITPTVMRAMYKFA